MSYPSIWQKSKHWQQTEEKGTLAYCKWEYWYWSYTYGGKFGNITLWHSNRNPTSTFQGRVCTHAHCVHFTSVFLGPQKQVVGKLWFYFTLIKSISWYAISIMAGLIIYLINWPQTISGKRVWFCKQLDILHIYVQKSFSFQVTQKLVFNELICLATPCAFLLMSCILCIWCCIHTPKSTIDFQDYFYIHMHIPCTPEHKQVYLYPSEKSSFFGPTKISFWGAYYLFELQVIFGEVTLDWSHFNQLVSEG